MGKFVIHQREKGLRFHLKAANGETIATSELYTTQPALHRGIASVRKNAPKAKLEDLTQPTGKPVTNPKFQLYVDKAGCFRFNLYARNGQIVASSQAYTSREACLSGIESVRVNAPDAEIEEEKSAV